MNKEVRLVTLPKEVAEAIEIIKPYTAQAYNLEVIASNARQNPISSYRVIKDWIHVNSVHAYFSALVNGYEVEKTEQDLFFEKFYSHAEMVSFYESGRVLDSSEKLQERYSAGFVAGAKELARAFNVQMKEESR